MSMTCPSRNCLSRGERKDELHNSSVAKQDQHDTWPTRPARRQTKKNQMLHGCFYMPTASRAAASNLQMWWHPSSLSDVLQGRCNAKHATFELYSPLHWS